jgi:hypothetical protein
MSDGDSSSDNGGIEETIDQESQLAFEKQSISSD